MIKFKARFEAIAFLILIISPYLPDFAFKVILLVSATYITAHYVISEAQKRIRGKHNA